MRTVSPDTFTAIRPLSPDRPSVIANLGDLTTSRLLWNVQDLLEDDRDPRTRPAASSRLPSDDSDQPMPLEGLPYASALPLGEPRDPLLHAAG